MLTDGRVFHEKPFFLKVMRTHSIGGSFRDRIPHGFTPRVGVVQTAKQVMMDKIRMALCIGAMEIKRCTAPLLDQIIVFFCIQEPVAEQPIRAWFIKRKKSLLGVRKNPIL